MSTESGIRFIDDLSSESPAVQQAVAAMIDEMEAERLQEEFDEAEAKAAAIAAVESAMAAASRLGRASRLAS